MTPPRPLIMGILNVTPDSFSDGGDAGSDPVGKGMRLADEGADWIDVGGESTRPGALPVTLDEELDRVLPAVRGLTARGVAVSIDTSKPEVARWAVAEGARMINDVNGGEADGMLDVMAESGVAVVLMHKRGDPATMQVAPHYENVVEEVAAYLESRKCAAIRHGISQERIWIDPGIGFGKTIAHNQALLHEIGRFPKISPTQLGISRKGFLGELAGTKEFADRVPGALAIHAYAQGAGVRMFRVHDVRVARLAVDAYAWVAHDSNP